MKFKLHNKLEIVLDNKIYTFYNTMLSSVFQKMSSFESFNKYLALGTGLSSNAQSNFKLTNYISKVDLMTEILQNNIKNGENYIKKSAIIRKKDFSGNYITEVGLCENSNNNPTIYNYISLISENTPNGIEVDNKAEIVMNLYIYLDMTFSSDLCFTAGDNKFISFLLGEGLQDPIKVVRGTNIRPNEVIEREIPSSDDFCDCDIQTSIASNVLSFEIVGDLENGETREVVFLVGDYPFARVNLLNYNNAISKTVTIRPYSQYIVDVGENVKNVTSVVNNDTSESETYFEKPYGSKFSDKITLPFRNLFNSTTPRFLSKDGNKIFFVLDDYIYGYKNLNFEVCPIKCGNIHLSNIVKIISFDSYVFVITKITPFIYCYKINNNELVQINFDLSNYPYHEDFSSIQNIDITLAKNGNFMLGYIDSEHVGKTIYFIYDSVNDCFTYDSYLLRSGYDFSYILAMYKNNCSDAMIIYLQEGENSSHCRLVTHDASKTETNVFTALAYYYTFGTKELYTKGRGIIIEKTSSPKMIIYYYPQKLRLELSIAENELDNYISTNLLYVIQKISTNSYNIYNLLNYNTPVEFEGGFPTNINQSKILDFEFLDDTLLFFMDDETEPIVAYNIDINKLMLENLSSNTSYYDVAYNEYDLLGKNNEGVIANLVIDISI